jgi:integrase
VLSVVTVTLVISNIFLGCRHVEAFAWSAAVLRRSLLAAMYENWQAKVLTEGQVQAALAVVAERRYPQRDRVMVLLSVRAGLRAKEIAVVTWGMVTDAEGNVGEALHLVNGASKGRRGGRSVPLNKELRAPLVALKATRNGKPADRIIHSERDIGMSAGAVQVWFHRLYASLGFAGASSHSGRRTFVTRCAKNIVAAGGSLRDVQELAGHSSLSTTRRYIQGDTEAKRLVVDKQYAAKLMAVRRS